jgi:hypothetical protein
MVAASLLLAFLTACAPESGPDSTEAPDDRPNVLLVMVDDMGFTDPAWDEYAADVGVVFRPSDEEPE